MRPIQGALRLCALAALGGLAVGCASSAGGGTGAGIDPGFTGHQGSAPVSSAAAPARTPVSYVDKSAAVGLGAADCGSGSGSGFSVSLVESAHGAATALAAVRAFVAGGSQPGFGSSTTVWRIVTDLGDTTALAPGITLEVTQLQDGSWMVTSGAHC